MTAAATSVPVTQAIHFHMLEGASNIKTRVIAQLWGRPQATQSTPLAEIASSPFPSVHRIDLEGQQRVR
jgi:hypothetical protein